MNCPNCQFENVSGANFCNACGTKLETSCQQCGKINPPGSNFCNKCGHSLSKAVSTNPSTATFENGKPNILPMDYPLHFVEHCPTVGTSGDLCLCDWSQYLAIDKASGIKSAVSLHVRFIYDEQVFKFTYRFDGQPILGSPITPYKGTNTVSPFIALGARSS